MTRNTFHFPGCCSKCGRPGHNRRTCKRQPKRSPTARTLEAFDRQLEANNAAIAAITVSLRALTQMVAALLRSPQATNTKEGK